MIIKKVETQPPMGPLTTDVLKVTLENDNIIYVPNDEANKDYQAIQQWISEGNTVIDNGE
tara:strand:+ start:197 stop:376 length:180 start_codon:yes stop_codon:yes gene_type:complete